MTTGFLLLEWTRWEQEETKGVGVTCVTGWAYIWDRKCSVCCHFFSFLCSTQPLQTGSPKCWLVGKTSQASIRLIHPHGQTSREVKTKAHWLEHCYNHFSFLYYKLLYNIKNRSIAMITIFLNVNIQYLLHFQIKVFLIYFVVIIFPPKKQKTKSTGTDESDNIFV